MSSAPSPKDWIILQCLGLRLAHEGALVDGPGNRVNCPVCRSPVALSTANPHDPSPEFRAELPSAPPRPTPPSLSIPPSRPGGPAGPVASAPERRRTSDEPERSQEFAPTALRRDEQAVSGFLSNLQHTDEHYSGRHVRVRKRRKKGGGSQRDVLTDWNSASEDIPEAEAESDPWVAPMPIPEEVIKEKERDFVVSEHFEDGQAVRRVKRVRKRRIFTIAQLFFRRLSFGMRVLTLTIVAAIFVVGTWYGIVVFRQKFAPVTFDDVVADQQPSPALLTTQAESGAADVVRSFLAARSIDEKLKYVRLPKRVRPLMEAWYRGNPDVPMKGGEVLNRDKFVENGVQLIALEMKVETTVPGQERPDRDFRYFVVEEIRKDGDYRYLVDWESYVNWQEMDFADFRLKQPRNPVIFRIKLRDSNYYHHEFTDQKKWLAAEIYYPYPDRNEFLFYGYIERGSRVWDQLSMFTERLLNPPVIVRLRYPENAISRDQVIIDSVVSPNWIATKDEPPAGYSFLTAEPAPR